MHNSQEGFTVALALAGFCALGVLSAVVPAVAVVLLVLLGLAVLAGLVLLALAWFGTRPEPVPTDDAPHHTTASTATSAALREVA